MEDNQLSKILDRYLTGQASEAEQHIIDQWYEDMDRNNGPDPGDFEDLENRLWINILKRISTTGTKETPISGWAKIIPWHGIGQPEKEGRE